MTRAVGEAVNVAIRKDRSSGVEERAFFFGPESAPLFGCLHLPPDGITAAVVMCSSIDGDFTLNYRTQVALGRYLAANGVAVQRFHYRGIGNSFGDPADMELKQLRDDALLAADVLLEQTSSVPLAFLAEGWGAFAAALASARFPAAQLILWQPLLSPSHYYRTALIAAMSRQVREAGQKHAPPKNLHAQLATSGSVNVLGFSLHRTLYETSSQRTLLDALGTVPRRVLVVQPDGAREQRQYEAIVSALRGRGSTVTAATAGKPMVSWFNRSDDRDPEETAHAVGACVRTWLIEMTSA